MPPTLLSAFSVLVLPFWVVGSEDPSLSRYWPSKLLLEFAKLAGEL